jgi:uncharacterized protein DUF4386
MATAANLRAHELLWRSSVAAELFAAICVTVLALVWLVLFRPVSRDLTWLAIFFSLLAHAIGTMSALDLLTTLFPLGDAPYLQAFTPQQLAALARLALRTHANSYGFSLLFSGCFFLIAGRLIWRSGYLPRLVGALYTVAGAGYIVHIFTLVLAPAMADRVFMVAAPFILVGEATLALYLLIKGVDVEGWNRRQAELAAASVV